MCGVTGTLGEVVLGNKGVSVRMDLSVPSGVAKAEGTMRWVWEYLVEGWVGMCIGLKTRVVGRSVRRGLTALFSLQGW
jgi:hypothetical protein